MGAILSAKEHEGDMATSLAHGRACAVITAGEKGCWYSQNGSPAVRVAGFPVKAIDTTGCGDVFHGAYAAAIARGESIADAVLLANASAALKATRPGGRLGIPNLATVRKFVKENR